MNLFLAFGVTSIIDLGANLDTIIAIANHCNQAGIVAPRVFYCGPLLNQPPLRKDISIHIYSPEKAKESVSELHEAGCSAVKVYGNLKADRLSAIIEKANALGIPVTGHVPKALSIAEALNLGMTHIQHATSSPKELIDERRIVAFQKIINIPERFTKIWESIDFESLVFQKLLKQMDSLSLFYTPTLTIESLFLKGGIPDQIKHSNNETLMDSPFESLTHDTVYGLYHLEDSLQLRADYAFQKILDYVYLMHEKGVKILAGTDGLWLGELLPGFGIHKELKHLLSAGMTPLEVLQSATINVAEAYKKEADLGSIEVGKWADLLILKKNPLDDIEHLLAIEKLFFKGQIWSPDSLKNWHKKK